MTMRLRPAGLVVAVLVMTACTSGGAVATTELTISAPTTSAPSTTTVPTTVPTPTTVLKTAPGVEATSSEISIALTFFDARNAYDVESAIASFSPEAHVHEYGEPFITSVDMYPALFDWLRVTGWQWIVDACHMKSGDANTSCAYHVENAWARAMGLAPVRGAIVFEIWDGVMRWVPDFKVDQTLRWDQHTPNEQLVEVWETVTDWITANYPTDVRAMISEDGFGPVLDARSIGICGGCTPKSSLSSTPP